MARQPYLIPFKAEHLLQMTNRDGAYYTTPETAWNKERLGPAFTGIVDDFYIGCAGIQIIMPHFGVAWAVLTKEVAKYPIWLTRVVKAGLNDIVRFYDLKRVEAAVLVNHEANSDWARYLGFTRERNGLARSYTFTGDAVVRYELII